MFMYYIVWSYSKHLLHHVALHLVVGKFQGKVHFRTFSKKLKFWILQFYAY